MQHERAARFSAEHPAPWLESVPGRSPVLLIAPHGGQAGPAARAALHPKVNDLHTADITRELASRIGATALINARMDRNALDCNRLTQLIERAPWLLEIIADQVGRLLERHGHATVLLIHGWNVIEPRLDFGLGARNVGGVLRPTAAARISASDRFINGPIADLAQRLKASGIKPSFGLRYPAGGAQNLLQAFTERHLDAEIEPVRRLARFARNGEIDAAQLELSVALRMPGKFRSRTLEELERSFLRPIATATPSQPARLAIDRTPRRRSPVHGPKLAPARPAPGRLGIEFYDARVRLGGMASFDLGAGMVGARIMMLLGPRRVALFTGEGKLENPENGLRLGPLSLDSYGNRTVLTFRGVAVVVPDAAAYLSIERALASGGLDESVEVAVSLETEDTLAALPDFSSILSDSAELARAAILSGSFGHLHGRVRVDGIDAELEAVARLGLSMTGPWPNRFDVRRTLWACLNGGSRRTIVEARVVHSGGQSSDSARVLIDGRWEPCKVARLNLETESFETAPAVIDAALILPGGERAQLHGEVESFVPLSRPGPNRARVYTSLGFARFKMNAHMGAGMFEYSRCIERGLAAEADEPDED